MGELRALRGLRELGTRFSDSLIHRPHRAFGSPGTPSDYSALVRLGVPIVVGQIGNVVLGFADTIMVGRHSMQELAAASFVNTMFTLVVIFATGFSYGLTPVVAACSGAARPGA